MTAQIKVHGYTRKAIEETLRICKDKNVLEEYLKQRETEIMDIMTTLFDQDYVTKMYGMDQREEGKIEGKREGIVEGKRETALNLLKCNISKDIIMMSTGLSLDEINTLENQID